MAADGSGGRSSHDLPDDGPNPSGPAAERFASPLHEARSAALLGTPLGAAFTVALLVALVIAAGWAVHRSAPDWLRPPLLWAAATSMVLVLFSWPFVRYYGRNPTVPSVLARDYGAGLAAYLGLVWVLAGAWTAVRQTRPSSPPPPDAPQ